MTASAAEAIALSAFRSESPGANSGVFSRIGEHAAYQTKVKAILRQGP